MTFSCHRGTSECHWLGNTPLIPPVGLTWRRLEPWAVGDLIRKVTQADTWSFT